jgi:hypothetical protein
VGGSSQLPCADANCAVGFIDYYFGLAVSGGSIYALFVTTHHPSDVTENGGRSGGYQQQMLAAAPRPDLGHRVLSPVNAERGPPRAGRPQRILRTPGEPVPAAVRQIRTS